MAKQDVDNLVNVQNGMIAALQSWQVVVTQSAAQVAALGGGIGEPGTQSALSAIGASLATALSQIQNIKSSQAGVAALADA